MNERTGCFPGSFNPLTIAHLTIAQTTVKQHSLSTLIFVVSERTLAKEDSKQPPADRRADDIRKRIVPHPTLQAAVTPYQLLADIADGYDLVVMGADKWIQIHEDRWYQNTQAKNDALARLPLVVIVPRMPYTDDDLRTYDHPSGVSILPLHDPAIAEVSSTMVRQGKTEWLA